MRTTTPPQLYRLNGIGLMLVGIYLLVLSLQLPVGTLDRPGAGLWPAVVSGALVVMSAVVTLTETTSDDYEPITRRIMHVGLAIAMLIGFVLLFAAVGLTLPTFLFTLCWMRGLARESWRMTLLTAVGNALAGTLVFVVLLGVSAPYDPILAVLTGGQFS